MGFIPCVAVGYRQVASQPQQSPEELRCEGRAVLLPGWETLREEGKEGGEGRWSLLELVRVGMYPKKKKRGWRQGLASLNLSLGLFLLLGWVLNHLEEKSACRYQIRGGFLLIPAWPRAGLEQGGLADPTVLLLLGQRVLWVVGCAARVFNVSLSPQGPSPARCPRTSSPR